MGELVKPMNWVTQVNMLKPQVRSWTLLGLITFFVRNYYLYNYMIKK